MFYSPLSWLFILYHTFVRLSSVFSCQYVCSVCYYPRPVVQAITLRAYALAPVKPQGGLTSSKELSPERGAPLQYYKEMWFCLVCNGYSLYSSEWALTATVSRKLSLKPCLAKLTSSLLFATPCIASIWVVSTFLCATGALRGWYLLLWFSQKFR